MKAIKCDICGKYAMEFTVLQDDILRDSMRDWLTNHKSIDDDIDVCKSCYDSLRKATSVTVRQIQNGISK